jgi:hypothetical protein
MNSHSNGSNGDDAARAGGIQTRPIDHPVSGTRAMSLEGKDALDLYLAKIGDNAAALKAQVALLQETLQERMELLREFPSSQPDDEQSRLS